MIAFSIYKAMKKSKAKKQHQAKKEGVRNEDEVEGEDRQSRHPSDIDLFVSKDERPKYGGGKTLDVMSKA